MTAVFADTSYYVAMLLTRDAHHDQAAQLTADLRLPLVTTTGVLAELGNYMSDPRGRGYFVSLIKGLQTDLAVTVVDLDRALFKQAFTLYASRPDQSWSLVDSASFVVMRARGLTDALTADHHFEQAGFTALMR